MHADAGATDPVFGAALAHRQRMFRRHDSGRGTNGPHGPVNRREEVNACHDLVTALA